MKRQADTTDHKTKCTTRTVDHQRCKTENKKKKYAIDTDRLERGITQSLYLMEEHTKGNELLYGVIGTTGVLYEITYKKKWACTCPDFIRRKVLCKHIYFILKRVLQYTTTELQEGVSDEDVVKNAIDRAEKHKLLAQQYQDCPQEGEVEMRSTPDCAICCEDIAKEDDIVYCRLVCGKALHRECYAIWSKINPICPSCRTEMTVTTTLECALNKFL